MLDKLKPNSQQDLSQTRLTDLINIGQPFDPSEFVHFRKRIKESGLELILSQTEALHPSAKEEKEV